MPRTLIEDHKKVVSIRFSSRMLERAEAILDGEQFGEFVRLAVLRRIESRERARKPAATASR